MCHKVRLHSNPIITSDAQESPPFLKSKIKIFQKKIGIHRG